MPNYDHYAKYRPELTEFDKRHLRYAAISNQDLFNQFRAEAPDWTPEANAMLGKFRGPNGHLYHNQEVLVHIDIATRNAREQLARQNIPMPDDDETLVRFPGISPRGKYSATDMQFAQRYNRVTAALQVCSPLVKAYVEAVMKDSYVCQCQKDVTQVAKEQRELNRAAKLCHSPEGQQILHQEAKNLETCAAVTNYDHVMQGLEFMVGLRKDLPPKEVQDLYHHKMKYPLPTKLMQEDTAVPIPNLTVQFEDFQDRIIHRQVTNPNNWGKTLAEMKQNQITADDLYGAIKPYAVETTKNALAPAFSNAVANKMNPRALLIIDGETAQERLNKMYPNNTLSESQAEDLTAAMVTSALLSGKRVEAFIPNARGRFASEPTVITRNGYQMEQAHPVVLSAWERFCNRLGFYKEKAAQADAYQRAQNARERVLNQFRGHVLSHPPTVSKQVEQKDVVNYVRMTDAVSNMQADQMNNFFGRDAEKYKEPYPIYSQKKVDGFKMLNADEKKVKREEIVPLQPNAFCIAYMVTRKDPQGNPLYNISDIMDPSKLIAEKRQAGAEFQKILRIQDQHILHTYESAQTLLTTPEQEQKNKADGITLELAIKTYKTFRTYMSVLEQGYEELLSRVSKDLYSNPTDDIVENGYTFAAAKALDVVKNGLEKEFNNEKLPADFRTRPANMQSINFSLCRDKIRKAESKEMDFQERIKEFQQQRTSGAAKPMGKR